MEKAVEFSRSVAASVSICLVPWWRQQSPDVRWRALAKEAKKDYPK